MPRFAPARTIVVLSFALLVTACTRGQPNNYGLNTAVTGGNAAESRFGSARVGP